jgi:hypothetical protein
MPSQAKFLKVIWMGVSGLVPATERGLYTEKWLIDANNTS